MQWISALTAGTLAAALLPALARLASNDSASIRFVDVTRPAGIDFHHEAGASGRRYMVEFAGSGVIVLDYDGDGLPDLYFVNGAPLPGRPGPMPSNALYRNLGNGTFADVTEAAGLEARGYGMGGAAADVDNDGDPDLLITAFGRNLFYRNNGGEGTVKLANRAPISWGTRNAPSTISWGRIGLEALNLTTPSLKLSVSSTLSLLPSASVPRVGSTTEEELMKTFLVLWMLMAPFASDDKLPRDEVKGAEDTVATFSIVARDPATGELGLAVQSRAFRAGRTVPYGNPGVGMIASQAAAANTPYGRKGMEMLEAGLSPEEIIKRLTEPDEGRDVRQVAVIDTEGRVKAYTGAGCGYWAGHIEGENYSVQGNILAGEEVVKAMARSFESSEGELAERLMAVLEAGQAAGGDARGMQAGAIWVMEPYHPSDEPKDPIATEAWTFGSTTARIPSKSSAAS